MRRSISAQSWDSVPPAPGWISRMASLTSSGSLSRVRICAASSLASISTRASSRARSISSVCSVRASSSHSRVLSRERSRASHSSTRLSSWVFSCRTGVSSSGLSQAPGEESCFSICARRSLWPRRSKSPPEIVEAFVELGGSGLEFRILQHGWCPVSCVFCPTSARPGSRGPGPGRGMRCASKAYARGKRSSLSRAARPGRARSARRKAPTAPRGSRRAG